MLQLTGINLTVTAPGRKIVAIGTKGRRRAVSHSKGFLRSAGKWNSPNGSVGIENMRSIVSTGKGFLTKGAP